MKIISIICGILAFVFMFPGLLPCLGWLNWGNIFFSAIGLIIALYLYYQSGERDNNTKIALFLNGCAFAVGVIRLFLGGGVF